jgi:hypothetical protein
LGPDWANFRLLGGCLLCAFFENFRNSPGFLASLSQGKIYVLILTSYILGDLFSNTSDHPDLFIY